MASPQVENGYVAIATELFEALTRTRIPGEARQVFDTILRKTYGWKKKEEIISIKHFTEVTGLSAVHVCQSVKKLKAMNMIVVTEKGNKRCEYGINKDFETWKLLPKKVTSIEPPKDSTLSELLPKKVILPKKVTTVTEKGNKYEEKSIDIYKKIKKKKILQTFLSDSIEIGLSEFFVGLLDQRQYPWNKKGKPDLQAWAIEFDKIIRIDGRPPDKIRQVLKWCQSDLFWQDNILSPIKLRKQWAQLELKMRKATNSQPLSSESLNTCKSCGKYYPSALSKCPQCK